MYTQAEVAEGRLKQDRSGHRQGDVDDEHANCIRENVLEDDPGVGGSGDPGGIYEFPLPQGQELTADKTGQAHPADESEENTQDDDAVAGREAGDPASFIPSAGNLTDDGCEEQQRNDDDDVGEAHED